MEVKDDYEIHHYLYFRLDGLGIMITCRLYACTRINAHVEESLPKSAVNDHGSQSQAAKSIFDPLQKQSFYSGTFTAIQTPKGHTKVAASFMQRQASFMQKPHLNHKLPHVNIELEQV
jgi:hypothetical protein